MVVEPTGLTETWMQVTKERKESRWLQDFGLVYHVTRWERLHGERFGERHFGDVSLR